MISRFLLTAALAAILTACSSGNDMSGLQQEIIQIALNPGGEIEPLPEFQVYEAFTYSAASLRSPFDIPLAVRLREEGLTPVFVEPDLNREREPLEGFALATLSMVGMLYRNNEYVGLVRDDLGSVHRVRVGQYLGRNHGRVGRVTDTVIELTEIVPSGDGGWVERPRTLTLQR
ncbi:MAG: pilus assembly protein PilP [Pseudomonadales bacterium]|nr:pilus assembly protein PilP [Pseudomonadales bacterium]